MRLHQVLKRVTAPGADSSVHRHWQEWGLLFQAPGGALPHGPTSEEFTGLYLAPPEIFLSHTNPSASSLPWRKTSRPANRSHQASSLSL